MLVFQLMSILAPEPYLDPGSGSILLQVILAALLGVGVILRTQWARIKSLFKGRNRSDEDADDEK